MDRETKVIKILEKCLKLCEFSSLLQTWKYEGGNRASADGERWSARLQLFRYIVLM